MALGFDVERHVVPDALCRKAGMISATNLVIRHRFGMHGGPAMTLKEIGGLLGLSRERVRQIECRAKMKMRAICTSRGAGRAAAGEA